MTETSAKRSKFTQILLLAGLVAIQFAILPQTWFQVSLKPGASVVTEFSANAGDTSTALSALAITQLAAVAVLAISGPVFRKVFIILAFVINGLSLTLSSWAYANPVSTIQDQVAELTGLSGETAIQNLISSIESSYWPLALIGLYIVTLVYIGFLFFAVQDWPLPSKKYEINKALKAETGKSDWDRLDSGDDFTIEDSAAS